MAVLRNCFKMMPAVPYTKKPLTFVKGFQAVRMGLEPTTSGVTGPHSNQLNYRTVFCCV